MRVVNVDENVIRQLKNSEILDEMKSLELCDWLVIHEEQGRIVGAGGVGTIFHITYLQIDKNFQSLGLGPRIFIELVNEAKKKNIHSCLRIKWLIMFKVQKYMNFIICR